MKISPKAALSRPGTLILMLLGVALLLRLPLLNGSFWLDEAAQALESGRPLSQQFDIIPDFQPPLLHLVVHFLLFISAEEWWLRLGAALIPGLITIYVTYLVGKEVSSPKVGLLAAALLATNSFHVFYSQELRPYSLPALWAVVSWWCLLKLVKTPKLWPWWIGFTLVSIAGIYSSYLYPFLLLAQALGVLMYYRHRLAQVVAAVITTGLTFIPWLPVFRQQLATGGLLREQLPGWDAVVSSPQLKSLPLVIAKFLFGVIDLKPSVFIIASSLLLVTGLGYFLFHFFQQRQQLLKPDPATKLLLLLILGSAVSLLGAWVISFWVPVVQPKRVLFLLPIMYVVLVSIFEKVKSPRYLRQGVVGLLFILNITGLAAYYTQPSLQRENWRTLHLHLTSHYPASRTVAVFAFPEPFAPWRWYDQGTYQTMSIGYLSQPGMTFPRESARKITEYEFVILFDYLTDLSDPQGLLIQEVEAFGYKGVELLDYPGIGFVRVYARPGETLSYERGF